MHLNIIQEFYRLNDYGWSTYLGYYRKNWVSFTTGISRILYLTIFADYFESIDNDLLLTQGHRTEKRRQRP